MSQIIMHATSTANALTHGIGGSPSEARSLTPGSSKKTSSQASSLKKKPFKTPRALQNTPKPLVEQAASRNLLAQAAAADRLRSLNRWPCVDVEVCPPNKKQKSMAAQQQLQTAVCPETPRKFGKFRTVLEQQSFQAGVSPMSAETESSVFDALWRSERAAEERLKKREETLQDHVNKFGEYLLQLSHEQRKTRYALEDSVARSKVHLTALGAKTTCMSRLNPERPRS